MIAKGTEVWADFSLVDGGLLHQIWRRLRLSGHFVLSVCERIGVLLLLVWAPLLLLSVMEGTAWNSSLKPPFLLDVETNLRLLVALPLLILAETAIHQRLRPIVGQFLERQLISEKELPQFNQAIASAMRLRSSMTLELILFALVYLAAIFYVQPTQGGLGNESWRVSTAGWWLRWVSLPVFQFLLLRWYVRIIIWARFLWQVSRLKLNTVPTHSDGCGGLGFLSAGCVAFAPFLLAQGTLLAAMMANRIFYSGARLPDFKLEVLSLVAIMLLTMLVPLLVFNPKLAMVKRSGRLEYGALVQRYVFEFDRKWLGRGAKEQEPLIGSADIQSLADLTNSYGVIERMRLVPFNIHTVVLLIVITLLPVLPLVLTEIPLKELSARLLKLVL